MTLMDIKKEEEWKSILDRFSRDVNMTACLIDEAGNSLLCSFDRYPLCKTVRDNQEAATYICSQTNVAMLAFTAPAATSERASCERHLAAHLRLLVRAPSRGGKSRRPLRRQPDGTRPATSLRAVQAAFVAPPLNRTVF